MRRWFRLASLGFVLVLLLSWPGGPRAHAQGGEGIIPPGEFSSKADPPPDTGPFTKNRQDEPWLALNPNNARSLAIGFNDWSAEPSCTNTTPSNCSFAPGISLSGFARSSNRGASYDSTCPTGGRTQGRIGLSALGAFAFGDPSLAFDSKGDVFYGTVGFPNNAPGVNADVFVAKSTDGGCNYPSAVDVSGNVKFDDKDSIAVDINSNSPCRDNVYLTWTELGKGGKAGPDQIVTSHSTDGGQTWTKPEHLSPGNPVGRSGAAVKADNGNVWVVRLDVLKGQPVQHMAISTDCGKRFDKDITVAMVNPVDGPYPGASFRVNSFPALATDPSDGNTLYVAWADRTNGHTVIKVAKSTTKGLTWNEPVVAGNVTNYGFTGRPASAFFPALDVDTRGNVNLAFLALQDKPAGTSPGPRVVRYAMFVRQSKNSPRGTAGGTGTWIDPLIGIGYGMCCSGDDPDASSTDDLKSQFLGDYISAGTLPALAPGGLGVFLVAWTDTSLASTCAAVDAFRAGTGSKPNIITQCSPTFGNTDIQLTQAFSYTP